MLADLMTIAPVREFRLDMLLSCCVGVQTAEWRTDWTVRWLGKVSSARIASLRGVTQPGA